MRLRSAIFVIVAMVATGCGRIGYDLFSGERFTAQDASSVSDAAMSDGGGDGGLLSDGSADDGAAGGADGGDDGGLLSDAGSDAMVGTDAGSSGSCPFIPCLSDRGSTAGATGSSGFAANTRDAPPSSGSCGGMGSQVSIVRFTASADLQLMTTVSGMDFDPLIYIRDGDCCGAELACDDNSGGGTTAEATVSLLNGESVYVIVDGAGPTDQGGYSLLFTRMPP